MTATAAHVKNDLVNAQQESDPHLLLLALHVLIEQRKCGVDVAADAGAGEADPEARACNHWSLRAVGVGVDHRQTRVGVPHVDGLQATGDGSIVMAR